MSFEAALAFVFGLLIGSFLNVCIYRMPRDLSVVTPRSFCPHCEHTVRWYDNIPLVSFFLLRGRCRDCGGPIPLRYPAVELLTACVFALAIALRGFNWEGVKLCIFGAIQIELVFSDLEERILPDEFTLGGIVVGLALAAVSPVMGLVRMVAGILDTSVAVALVSGGWMPRLISVADSALAAGVCALALWGVGALYQRMRGREGVGPGDVKMVAMIGAFLGLQGALLALMLGSILGAVCGLTYILVSRKDVATYELPYGTFLGAAALGVAMFAERLLGWYGGLG